MCVLSREDSPYSGVLKVFIALFELLAAGGGGVCLQAAAEGVFGGSSSIAEDGGARRLRQPLHAIDAASHHTRAADSCQSLSQ